MATGAIARLAVEAGRQVVLSNSRGPETVADTVAELGPRVSAATREEAAAAGDIVVVTVPVAAFPDVPAAPPAGTTVIDTCNYGLDRDGHIPEFDGTSLTSSELLLRYVARLSAAAAHGEVRRLAASRADNRRNPGLDSGNSRHTKNLVSPLGRPVIDEPRR
ncbi:NAD(P)-binding domain-containing protein [Kribbella sp. NPDC050459]|uniref:NAD(P)-binding domain-containing protein n=1 Tax=Kribbella sp. NPDC050459 TaxID=3155785 RepID=UPI0033F4607E